MFRIFHAGLTIDVIERYRTIFPDALLNVMLSFGRRTHGYYNILVTKRNIVGQIALDSGVFSYNNNPEKHQNTITFPLYKSYLHRFSKQCDFYLNFDENFAADGFEENYDIYQYELENEGLSPVPVIHDCHGPEIDHYISEGYRQVAIGSGELKNGKLSILRLILDPLHKAGVKIHFLGSTKFESLAPLPVSSCDSSSWTQAGARGYILFWNDKRQGKNKIDKVYFDDNVPQNILGNNLVKYIAYYPFQTELSKYLWDEFAFTFNDLVGPDRIMNRRIVNLRHFVLLEEKINRRHQRLGFFPSNLDKI